MSRTILIGAAVAAILASAAYASQSTQRSVFGSPLLLMSPSFATDAAIKPTRDEAETPSRRDRRAEMDAQDRRNLALIGLLTIMHAKNGQIR